MNSISDNIQAIQERMALAAERSGRSARNVALVVVTKTVSVERIREAVAAGALHLGENRVQEAESKFGTVGETTSADLVRRQGLTLHMIGGLQRNKARRAVELFDWVQSVDRPELLAALDKAAGELGRERLPVLLEVNTTGEEAKSGIAPADLPRLADALAGCSHVRAMGLMTVARLDAAEAELRRTFSGLRQHLEALQKSHPELGDWRHLSMGMSDDYELAIEEGSTMVRLGRAVFGARS